MVNPELFDQVPDGRIGVYLQRKFPRPAIGSILDQRRMQVNKDRSLGYHAVTNRR